MRIVFMGTPEFAAKSLRRILDDGHEVIGVFTQPDRPKGRGYHLAPPEVKVLAQEAGLPVYQPVKLRNGQVAAQIRDMKPDALVVVAYGRILLKEILEIPPLGSINVHASLLPRYRGAAPIQWSVVRGEKVTGVTTMYMAEGVDTGDMILQSPTEIGPDETYGELHDRLAEIGAQCLSETLPLLAAGNAPRRPQEEGLATFAPVIEKAMAKIDFTRPAEEVHNLVRGMNPWPAAHTVCNGRLLKVYRTKPLPDTQAAPGMLLDAKRLVVGCGSGAVELLEVQPEGGKRMAGDVFLRGKRGQAEFSQDNPAG